VECFDSLAVHLLLDLVKDLVWLVLPVHMQLQNLYKPDLNHSSIRRAAIHATDNGMR
jgi:hypothetical protein